MGSRRRYLSTEEAAMRLNMHPNTVRNKIKKGEIPYQRTGGARPAYRVSESYVVEREAQRTRQRKAQASPDAQDVANLVLAGLQDWLEEHGPRVTGLSERDRILGDLREEQERMRGSAAALTEEVRSLKETLNNLSGLLPRLDEVRKKNARLREENRALLSELRDRLEADGKVN